MSVICVANMAKQNIKKHLNKNPLERVVRFPAPTPSPSNYIHHDTDQRGEVWLKTKSHDGHNIEMPSSTSRLRICRICVYIAIVLLQLHAASSGINPVVIMLPEIRNVLNKNKHRAGRSVLFQSD